MIWVIGGGCEGRNAGVLRLAQDDVKGLGSRAADRSVRPTRALGVVPQALKRESFWGAFRGAEAPRFHGCIGCPWVIRSFLCWLLVSRFSRRGRG